jgi:hydroxypyruvate isomerase
MLGLSVCIELIFAEREFSERLEGVAEAGCPAFEFWGWQDKPLDAIAAQMDSLGLVLANMNLDPLVSLAEKGNVDSFVAGVRESCAVAKRLNCQRLATPVENVNWGPGQPWYAHLANKESRDLWKRGRDRVVEGLKRAAIVAEGEGIVLLLEPLNTVVDHRGYFLSSSQQAVNIIREVDSPSVKILFDAYHQQITEGNLIVNLTENIDLVGHIHLADVPGRHEPGTGEINFFNFLTAAKQAGYDGYIGLEYEPRAGSMTSLAATKELLDAVKREAD